jgi:dienelactone hydrolase
LFPQATYITQPSIYLDPVWMVSHEYLVFLPDIIFTKDEWGPSTVNAIEGAANRLSKLPFVDTKRIAACGHSNSGRYGYYLLTHSNKFAAISLASGRCGPDMISCACSIYESDGTSLLYWAERSATGAALGDLWKNKDRWIDHTAIVQADKITAPFLMMYNKQEKGETGDDFRLGRELFIAMRRLEKKSWWLDYDNSGHEA